jgi:hypothetical protein
MEIIPPPGFLSLRNARDVLMQCMHKGIPPSEDDPLIAYMDAALICIGPTRLCIL